MDEKLTRDFMIPVLNLDNRQRQGMFDLPFEVFLCHRRFFMGASRFAVAGGGISPGPLILLDYGTLYSVLRSLYRVPEQ